MSAHRVLRDLYEAFKINIGPGIVQDPGNAGTIEFDKYGQICELTSGASGETRTLKNPNRPGILATLRMVTDGGGTIVITASNGLNPSNETLASFGDEGDSLYLMSVTKSVSDGTYRWDVIDGNVGVVIHSASASSTPSASVSNTPSTSPSATASSSPSAT